MSKVKFRGASLIGCVFRTGDLSDETIASCQRFSLNLFVSGPVDEAQTSKATSDPAERQNRFTSRSDPSKETVTAKKRIAVISGAGALPAAVVRKLSNPLICALEGFEPSDLVPDLTFRIERLVPFFQLLRDADVTEITFAGTVQRPRLDPSFFDPGTALLVPRLLAAMQKGDQTLLAELIELLGDSGFTVRSTDQIAPDLVPTSGVLAGEISRRDEVDASRAESIVRALSSVGVGQSCVVVQGLCLAAEALSGCEAMLEAVAALPRDLRPNPAGGLGLLYKASSSDKDRLLGLPTIGPSTVSLAARAALGGIVWQAGSVICVDLPEMISVADKEGLFLWAR